MLMRSMLRILAEVLQGRIRHPVLITRLSPPGASARRMLQGMAQPPLTDRMGEKYCN
jgi:hypothetical protein